MNQKVAELLNDQINKEFYSAYLYLDIANFFSAKGLDGFANWYTIQAKEEQDHGMLFYTYLHNNSIPVELKAIAKPDKVFADLKDPLNFSVIQIQITGMFSFTCFSNTFPALFRLLWNRHPAIPSFLDSELQANLPISTCHYIQ